MDHSKTSPLATKSQGLKMTGSTEDDKLYLKKQAALHGNSEHVENASDVQQKNFDGSHEFLNAQSQDGESSSEDNIKSWDFASSSSSSSQEEGSGPGLREPDDSIQQSESRNWRHVESASKKVGAGPGLLNNAGDNERPSTAHRPHHAEESKNGLATVPTYSSTTKTQYEVERHETALSSIRSHIGLPSDPPIIDEHRSHHHLTLSSIRYVLREPFAEFFGTFVMVLFGNGSVAQVLLSTGQTSAPGGMGYGSYQSINWGWGIGVMLGIYIAGDSGGFLNPGVTAAFCFFRRLPLRRFPIYSAAQILGGMVGSAVVYGNYINAINSFEGGSGIRTVPPAAHATAGIFCTYPQAFLTKTSQFFSEFIASTILIFVIFAMKDDSNPGAMGKSGAGMLFPIVLLFLIYGLGLAFGWETGYAINIARDFGPRLVSYMLGYGTEVWSAGDYYFWIPMVAPFCGCFFGGFLYDAFVYTGPETPLNTPWLGLKGIMTGQFWRDDRAKEREKGDKMV